jgi:hypothetical protein
MRSKVVRSIPAALFLGLGGCYSQVPLEVAVPLPATRIVAQVTDSGAVALGNTIGSGALEVEGVVTEATPEEWKLQVLRVNDKFGASSVWQGQLITFPRFSLTRPRARRIDKQRSWMAAGGIVLGAVLAGRLFGGFVSDDGPDDNPTPPQAIILAPGGIRP